MANTHRLSEVVPDNKGRARTNRQIRLARRRLALRLRCVTKGVWLQDAASLTLGNDDEASPTFRASPSPRRSSLRSPQAPSGGSQRPHTTTVTPPVVVLLAEATAERSASSHAAAVLTDGRKVSVAPRCSRTCRGLLLSLACYGREVKAAATPA